VYRDDKQLEDFHKQMGKLAKDCDAITKAYFVDLQARGKIKTTYAMDLSLADIKPSAGSEK
jgi:hypothetical protein